MGRIWRIHHGSRLPNMLIDWPLLKLFPLLIGAFFLVVIGPELVLSAPPVHVELAYREPVPDLDRVSPEGS
jgi:hypothetical protein